MAAMSPVTLPAAAVSCSGLNSSMRTKPRVAYIEGMNSFDGLKAHNNIATLGMPACSRHSFAKVVSSLKAAAPHGRSKGGALTSTCNAAGEIFKIAAIMNGLVLVGIAVGFVLLRVEQWMEESEQ